MWLELLKGKAPDLKLPKGKARRHYAKTEGGVKNDPEYVRAAFAAYYERNKEKLREKARIKAKEKYDTDPEYRAQVIERQRKWRQENKDAYREQNRKRAKRRRDKLRQDPEWRAKERARLQAFRERKRAEKKSALQAAQVTDAT